MHDGSGKLVRFHNHLTAGGIACAMSHRAALEAVATHQSADWGLILEDDITGIVPHVHEAIAKVLQCLPPSWDAVFLGYHGGCLDGTAPADVEVDEFGQPLDGHEASELFQEEARAKLELQIDDMRRTDGRLDGFHGTMNLSYDSEGKPNVPVIRMYLPLFGLYAWMVPKEAARAALDGAFPVDGQVDHALSQWLISARGRCFRVAPRHMLFFSPKSEDLLDSDVQTMARVEDIIGDPERCERYLDFVNRGLSPLEGAGRA